MKDLVKSKGGRPPGSKNRTTLLQEAIRNDFTRLAKRRSKKIFEILTEKAMEGDPAMIKLFMDKIMPNAQVEGERPRGDFGINIVITDMKGVEIKEDIEDGEFTDA